MNPIWKRESLARWRGWRAFALAFFYVAILAAVFAWRYGDFLSVQYDPYGNEYFDPLRRLAALGHELFVLMAWMQLLMWLILAPILTSTAISSERERGMLEALQLSRLSAWQIVWGKLWSAFSLILFLILITSPIIATCFLMGGVSPGDFGIVLMLQILTALASAALGLACSAWSKRSGGGIGAAIVAAITYNALTYWAIVLRFSSMYGRGASPLPWYHELVEVVSRVHPLIAILDLLFNFSKGGLPWSFAFPTWYFSAGFLPLATLFLLWIAKLGTERILAEPLRVDWDEFKKDMADADSLARPLSASPIAKPQQQKPNLAGRMELGVLSRLQFSNPILGREVRAIFRPRRSSLLMTALAVLLMPFLILAYGYGLYRVSVSPETRYLIGPALFFIAVAVTIFISGLVSSSSIARERETGTLEPLRLCQLSTREILWGKVGAPVFLCAFLTAVFLPLVLACVRSVTAQSTSYYEAYGISLTQVAGGVLIIAATTLCCTMFGLYVSSICRRAVTATCWVIGAIFFGYVALPIFLISWNQSRPGYYESEKYLMEFLRFWHPVVGMMAIFDRRMGILPGNGDGTFLSRHSVTFDAVTTSMVLLSITAVLYFLLIRSLHAKRERLD